MNAYLMIVLAGFIYFLFAVAIGIMIIVEHHEKKRKGEM
jgi:hypothetical protein